MEFCDYLTTPAPIRDDLVKTSTVKEENKYSRQQTQHTEIGFISSLSVSWLYQSFQI